MPPSTVSSIVQQPFDQCSTCRRGDGAAAGSGRGSEPTKKKSSVPADQASVTAKPGVTAGAAISAQAAVGGDTVGHEEGGGGETGRVPPVPAVGVAVPPAAARRRRAARGTRVSCAARVGPLLPTERAALAIPAPLSAWCRVAPRTRYPRENHPDHEKRVPLPTDIP